jgi:anti-anti-sigma regulatory factor
MSENRISNHDKREVDVEPVAGTAKERQAITLSTEYDFDLENKDEFTANFEDAINNPEIGRVVVNLSETEHMDSAARGSLIKLNRNTKEMGKILTFRMREDGEVHKDFRRTLLDTVVSEIVLIVKIPEETI